MCHPRSTRSAQKVSTVSHFLNGSLTLAVYTPFTPFPRHTIESAGKSVKEVSHSSTLLCSGV